MFGRADDDRGAGWGNRGRDSPSSPRRTCPAPRIARCATNFCAEPASRLNVSTPTPQMSRSLTRKRAACSLNPGACIVPFRVPIEESIGVADTGIPAGVHRHERTGRDAAVALLPLKESSDRDERVGILGRAIGNRDDHERRNEPIDRKAIGRDSPRRQNATARRRACPCARRTSLRWPRIHPARS